MSKNHHGAHAPPSEHIPVMLQEVLAYLRPRKNQSYLDATAGYGGHAEAVLARTKNPGKAMLIDRDKDAISALRVKFAKTGAPILHQDFLAASRQLLKNGSQFDMILADLGISSPHLEGRGRGFSFKKSELLDMRMDQGQALSALTVLNDWPEEKLVEVLRNFGEEPKAGAIARQIVTNRPLRTTDELAAITKKVWPGRSKIHPATRSFQAIRVAVNDELSQLKQVLPVWEELLAPAGRLVVISFHSLEDRLIKSFMAEHSAGKYDSSLELLTKKPITPSPDEIVSNPRARSAKLRACRKK